MSDSSPSQSVPRGTVREVFYAFLRQGSISFGGPIAHLGYYHTEFVERRQWCDEQTFAEIVALAQSMPGPASSQVCFVLGLLRAGWLGSAAAWFAFTMPSALLMLAFAFGHTLFTGKAGLGVIHGLQLVAVAVVAQAILSMRKSLAPDVPRIMLALVAAAIVYFGASTLLAIATGALLGILLPRPPQAVPPRAFNFGVSRMAGLAAGVIFLALLLLPFIAPSHGARQGAVHAAPPQTVTVFDAFYRTGALVFGGGHVVLPLLEHAVVDRGWVDQQSFLSGYGAAQAIPGPLFTFAAYLGAAIRPTPNPIAFSALALVAIFLPGLLIIVAVLPFWNRLRQSSRIQSSLRGVNAAVVGILLAAFIRPVWSSAVHSVFDLLLAAISFALLLRYKLPPWLIVVAIASISAVASVV
jgi:chromate transporter